MTDGNTYAINKHLDEREDYDALQEVTTELEQAEAGIEELEGRLASAVDVLLEGVQAEADNIMLIGRIKELEAKLTKAVSALGGMVGLFSGYSLLLKGTHLKIVLYNARAALAELKRARR